MTNGAREVHKRLRSGRARSAQCALGVALGVLVAGVAGGATSAEPPTRDLTVKKDQANTAAEPSAIGTTDEGLIELHVRDLDLSVVLRLLSVHSKRNIITSPGISGTVTADLHGVTFEEALGAVLRSQGMHSITEKNFIYVMTRDEYDAITSAGAHIQTRVYRLYYIPASEAAQLITPILSNAGEVAQSTAAEAGIGSSPDNAGGDNFAMQDTLVVSDYPDNLRRIGEVLRELDVRPKQVLVEATILRAQIRDQNELGIDFNILGGVNFEQVNGRSLDGSSIEIGPIPSSEFEDGLAIVETRFSNTISAGGFTFGVIKDPVAVFIRALEQVTDATIIANPKILTLNKQRGEIIVGRRDGYLTTTVTETAAIQTVEFLETGTQLLFRPFIGNDGYVRMEIHPEDSAGGLTSANLPFEETTEVTANIMVRDGYTILIGGLFRERTTAGRAQVPFLGSIPGLGLLFQRVNDDSSREEVIILLTVRILKDDDAEAEEFAGLVEDVERIRVGARRRLHFSGRERLAQAHYHWAVQHVQRGDLDKAEWDLNMTLHNTTRMLEAIKLVERIRQRRTWEEEGTRMHTFVREMIEGRGADSQPFYGRPDVLYNSGLPSTEGPESEADPNRGEL